MIGKKIGIKTRTIKLPEESRIHTIDVFTDNGVNRIRLGSYSDKVTVKVHFVHPTIEVNEALQSGKLKYEDGRIK